MSTLSMTLVHMKTVAFAGGSCPSRDKLYIRPRRWPLAKYPTALHARSAKACSEAVVT